MSDGPTVTLSPLTTDAPAGTTTAELPVVPLLRLSGLSPSPDTGRGSILVPLCSR